MFSKLKRSFCQYKNYLVTIKEIFTWKTALNLLLTELTRCNTDVFSRYRERPFSHYTNYQTSPEAVQTLKDIPNDVHELSVLLPGTLYVSKLIEYPGVIPVDDRSLPWRLLNLSCDRQYPKDTGTSLKGTTSPTISCFTPMILIYGLKSFNILSAVSYLLTDDLWLYEKHFILFTKSILSFKLSAIRRSVKSQHHIV